MSDTEIGIAICRPSWRVKFGFRSYGFEWKPGIEESGSSSPPQYFDHGCADEHWIWAWLCLCVFFARVR